MRVEQRMPPVLQAQVPVGGDLRTGGLVDLREAGFRRHDIEVDQCLKQFL